MSSMDNHPPKDYDTADLQTFTLNAGTPLFRTFYSKRGHNGALFFAKDTESNKSLSGRYGDLNMKTGVCYMGESFHTSVVETVLHDDANIDVVFESDLCIRSLVKVSFNRDLKLVQFYGDGLINNSASVSLTTQEHMQSRLWSTQIMLNANNYDGIIWRCKLNNDLLSVVIFETAESAIDIDSMVFHDSLLGRELRNETASILAKYNIDIAPSS